MGIGKAPETFSYVCWSVSASLGVGTPVFTLGVGGNEPWGTPCLFYIANVRRRDGDLNFFILHR